VNLKKSGRWAAHQQLLRRCDGEGGWPFFRIHCQHQPLITIGERGAVLLDFCEEANFVLRKFTEGLWVPVARRFGPGEKVASEMSMASAIWLAFQVTGTVWPFSTRER